MLGQMEKDKVQEVFGSWEGECGGLVCFASYTSAAKTCYRRRSTGRLSHTALKDVDCEMLIHRVPACHSPLNAYGHLVQAPCQLLLFNSPTPSALDMR